MNGAAELAGYDVLLELTRGGMGEVLLARKRGAHGFERLVAVKTIRGDLRAKDEMRSMFLDEARLMARLHHPAIAQVHDFAESEGVLCLVMEYVPGVSFGRLASLRPPPEVAAQAIAEVLRGLHAAHELRDDAGEPLDVVHRDVSPQNLMVSFEGRVKILDFGIARMRRRQAPETELGLIKGKPAYMAPEQLRNQSLDRRADIFAAAIVLHEMLTGEPLFERDSPFQVAHAVAFGEVPPPSAKAGPLPNGLDEIVMRGLARDRADRFQTAEAMADALDRVVAAASGPTLESFVRRALATERERHDERLRAAVGEREDVTAPAVPEGRPTGMSTAVDLAGPAGDVGTSPADAPAPASIDPAPSPLSAPESSGARRRAIAAGIAILAVSTVGAFAVKLRQAPVASSTTAVEPGPEAPSPETAVAPPSVAPEPEPVVAQKTAIEPPARPNAPATAPRTSAGPVATAPAQSPAVASAEPPGGDWGFLTVGADPYALVQIDGASVGPTPIFKRKMPAGSHVVVLTSPDTGEVRVKRTVQLAPGGSEQVIAR